MVRWTEAPEEPAYDLAEPDYDEPEPRRRRKGGVTFLLVLFVLGFLAYAVVRVLSLETVGNLAFVVGAMALTPYVVVAGWLLVLVTFLLKRRLLALVVLVIALSISALLGPRYLSEEQPEANGPRLRIMAANLYLGQANARTIIDLVRQQKIDVLTLPELTPDAVSALDSAGLSEVLPYRVFDDRVGGDGSGIAANIPLRKVILMPDSKLAQPSAVLDLPRGDDIELTAVHIQPPLYDDDVNIWRTELANLPKADPDERLQILAGDFNATLDHGPFRAVVDRGYADAAEETGKGLDPTWSSLPTGPPLTIDHIVADARCAIASYAVYDLPGSDHDAVIAEVVLP